MATNFPTGLDTLTNPTATDEVAIVSHSSQHTNANDAIEALEAKVGQDNSAVTTSHDYKLSGVIGTDKAVSKTGTETLTNKTLTTPVVSSIYQDAGKTKLMSLPDTASDTLVSKDATQTLKNKTITDDTNTVRANSLKSATTTISVDGATAPTTGQVLTAINSTSASWQSSAGTSNILADFIANENLTAGQPVGASNLKDGYVSLAKNYTKVAHGIPNFTESSSNYISCEIGGNKFVQLGYSSDTSGTLYAQVSSISGVSVTLGTPAIVATNSLITSGLSSATVCKLDTDKFIVFYVLDASTTIVRYRVGTVSGTTISFGTEATAHTAGAAHTTSSVFAADYLSTNKGALVTKNGTTASNSVTVAFTVSGTVATFGTASSLNTNSYSNGYSTNIKTIATDKFVVVTSNSTSSTYAQVFTCSGTTITAGTEAQISTATTVTNSSNMMISNPTSNTFVVKFYNNSTLINLVACTVSGTTITAGTTVQNTTTLANINDGGIYMLNTTDIYVSCGVGVTLYKFTLSGTTITEVGIQAYNLFNQTSNYYANNTIVINSMPVFVYRDATYQYCFIYGMSNNFIGIAQSTKNASETVSVLLKGKDVNQSGLFSGGKYLVSLGSLSIISNTATVDTQDDTTTVIATSPTTIIV